LKKLVFYFAIHGIFSNIAAQFINFPVL
jgi:hypothetical protein